jgi:hypothetical protein
MVGKGNTRHAIVDGLINKLRDACLTVEQRVLAMYV